MNTAESSPETEDDPLVQICEACGAAIDISDEEPLAEIACPACGAVQTVSGKVENFELQQVVGRGGMGVVYKAYDRSLDRFVALKLMRRDRSNPTIVSQMEKEATTTASINHPHVVRAFTSGTDHGRFFIAMELVDKGTLYDLIHLQGRVAEAQVLEVGIQIAQGLRAALQSGLIHRDVKPGNILFADSHTAKIVDFGLAMLMGADELNGGEIWGTPYYVAPEKLDRKPEDFRSDMYSLGGTLFHALAGRPPFEAEDASMVALKHLKSQAVSLQAFAPHVSGETAYVINRTLAKDPNERYQSYDELIEHLEYALEQLRAHGGQPQQKKRVVLEGEDEQKAMGWVTAGMIGLIVLLGVGLFAFRNQIFRDGNEAAAAANPAGPVPEARKRLVAGETAGAIELLRRESANPKTPPLEQSWAMMLEGIAQLINGDAKAAAGAFDAVEKKPSKSKGDDEKAELFLKTLAHDMAGNAPIPVTAAGALDPNGPDIFAIFAYGVKDWALRKSVDAAKLLRQFRETPATGKNAWMLELRPLASALIEQQLRFEMAAQKLKDAKRPQQYDKALAELRAIKGGLSSAVADLERSLPKPKPIALPKLGEWSQVEFGPPDPVPSASLDPRGVFTIKTAGNDLGGSADHGYFVYRAIKGDFELSAHFISLAKIDSTTKAALMIRDTLKPDARDVAVVATPQGGVTQQLRGKANAPSGSTPAPGGVNAPAGVPVWLKITRKGDVITGYCSADGKAWTEIRQQKLENLPTSVFAGIAVAAHSSTKQTTAKIDNVALTPQP